MIAAHGFTEPRHGAEGWGSILWILIQVLNSDENVARPRNVLCTYTNAISSVIF